MNCFFSSRRRHTRYWRDWSSDVCSSDLRRLVVGLPQQPQQSPQLQPRPLPLLLDGVQRGRRVAVPPADGVLGGGPDPESVVYGKRVDLGGRRIIKKKKFCSLVSVVTLFS